MNFLKSFIISFRNIALIFVIIEVLLGIFLGLKEKRSFNKKTESIIKSKAYKNAPDYIIREIYDDLFAIKSEWNSYIHYKGKTFSGKHNNINDKGIRLSTNFNQQNNTEAIKIFCFGGSTMYSTGARDEYSIPSEISKLLHIKFPDKKLEISNFGYMGYQRNIENILLQKELIKNNIPDFVIFYDGVNEITSSFLTKTPGQPTIAHIAHTETGASFNYGKKIKLVLNTSNIYKVIKSIKNKIFKVNTINSKLTLENKIAKNYKNCVKITNALSKSFNFKVLNFLQPVIYTKNKLSTVEEKLARETFVYKDLYINSYNLIQKDSLLKKDITFHDISNVFNNIESTIYTDFCHTNEYANKLVAEKITKKLVPYFKTTENK
ncbi:hypothetical protein CXF68_08905 [Tenacibaculum sp. Bg11-29]|uniref:hypothetical protein n=1 Tax=Tenacibaculum sp. Bg11-29 TaxID=2058306 RepID=UPI000C338727|nr:hypothetical protein [Tenacibaculum sp. Bg11-29]PKH50798.1 hypothetical protein CXF68_08905 [Tenacibaculum sp. Bg11-29]